MTKMRAAFMMLAGVIAAVPVALYAQSDLAQADPTQTTKGGFTIATDVNSGGVWRLNANTGELWFCLASGAPQCHRAVDAKK